MKKSILFIIILTITIPFLKAQSKKKNKDIYSDAEISMDEGNWAEASKLFEKLLETNKKNANYNFKEGYCLLSAGKTKEAIPYLEKAISHIDTTDNYKDDFEQTQAPIETYFYLGKAYHEQYRFEESLFILNKLLHHINPKEDKEFFDKIKLVMRYDTNAIELVKHPVEMSVENLGDSINSPYSDHSPVFTADESMLFFTSRRNNGHEILPDGEYDEDIYYSIADDDGNWSAAKNIGPIINTTEHDATVSISIDGSELYIYRDDDNGSIYVSKLDDKNNWTKPVKLPAPINSKYRETHASLGADNMTLYFTSDRPGGYGGRDIYVVRKLPNGKWGIPQNLGPQINTPFNEEGPFIHPDGKTLFFSSQGHNSMGGYDIFYSSYNKETKTWSKPVNIGYPINTTMDDVFYVPTPDGKRAYYASKQFNSIGGTDIFLITLPGLKEKGLTVMSGYILTAQGEVPQNTNITVSDIKNGNVVGIYTPNPVTGKYLFILRPGKNYNVSVEADGFSYFSENISVPKGSAYRKVKKVIKLNPIILGNINADYFVKFNPDDTTLIAGIKRELDNMAKFMKVNDTLQLNILLRNTDGNQLLNNKRKEAIKRYLINKGVSAKRIHTNKQVSNGINLTILNNNDTSAKSSITTNKYGLYIIGPLSNSNSLTEKQKKLLTQAVLDNGKNIKYNVIAKSESEAKSIKNYLITQGISASNITTSSDIDSNSINLLSDGFIVANLQHTAGSSFLSDEERNTLDTFVSQYGTNAIYNIISPNNKGAEQAVVNYLLKKGINIKKIFSGKDNMPTAVNIKININMPGLYTEKLEITPGQKSLTEKQKSIIDKAIASHGKNIPYYIKINDNNTYNNVKKYLQAQGITVVKTIPNNGVIIEGEQTKQWTEKPLKNYTKNQKEVRVNAILFDFDKWQTSKFDDVMYNLYNYMKNNPEAEIMLHGHTDVQGSEEYNMILSKRRAMFVKNYLVSHGIKSDRIKIKAHGESNPIAINISPKSRRYNRRVECEVLKQGKKQKLICIPVQVPNQYKIKSKL